LNEIHHPKFLLHGLRYCRLVISIGGDGTMPEAYRDFYRNISVCTAYNHSVGGGIVHPTVGMMQVMNRFPSTTLNIERWIGHLC
jgi:NAD kinase